MHCKFLDFKICSRIFLQWNWFFKWPKAGWWSRRIYGQWLGLGETPKKNLVWPKVRLWSRTRFRETLKILCLAKSPIMVKDQDNQRNSEYLNGQKPIFLVKNLGIEEAPKWRGWLKASSNKVWVKCGEGLDQNLLWYQMRRTKFAHTRIIQNILNIVIKSIWTNIYVIRMNSNIR